MPLRADVITGETTLDAVDLRLPGYLPLVLARGYRSGDDRDGPFGHGWTFNLDLTLTVEKEQLTYCAGTPRESVFTPIDVGVEARHATGLTLQHHPDAYVVLASHRLQQVFPKKNARRGVLRAEAVEDPDGNRIQFVYNGKRLTGLVDTLGRRVVLDYGGDRVQALRVSDGSEAVVVRSFRYDGRGRLRQVTDAAGRSTTLAYDGPLVVEYTNRLGGAWYAQYDAEGRCHALWRSDGSETRRLFYDPTRQTTRVVRSDGSQTIYRHVARAQVLEQIDPAGDAQNYYWDEGQHLIGFSDEQGTVVAFQRLDPEENTLTLIDGEERTAFFEVDGRGLATSIADAFENRYVPAYDDRHHLVGLTTPSRAEWTFERDRRGTVTAVVSPESRRVRLARSRDGREVTVEDDLGLCYRERYDAFGRITEREDALGRRTRWRYDAAGRLLELRVGDRYVVQADYDAAGNPVRITDADHGQTSLRYDTFGRLQAYTGPEGRRFKVQYDAEGCLTGATDARGRTARFDYDGYGRLIRRTDFEGRVATMSYGAEGVEVVTEGADGPVTRRYNALRDPIGEAFPDGTERRFEYGPCGELLRAEGERGTLYLDYDAEGRLAGVDTDEATLAFSYDRDGCLLDVKEGEETLAACRYDARGRLVEVTDRVQSAYRFDYDEGNRLATLRLPDGGEMTFRYDALDRLLERRVLDAQGREHDRRAFAMEGTGVLSFDVLSPQRADLLYGPEGSISTTPESPSRLVGPDLSGQEGSFSTRQEEASPLDRGEYKRGGPGQVKTDPAEAPFGMIELLPCRHGLVLFASAGGLRVPIWFQDDALSRRGSDLTRRVVAALVRGTPDVSGLGRRPLHGPALLRHWTRSRPTGFTEVPQSRDLSRRWPVLDRFFLARIFHDVYYPQDPPAPLPRHQGDLARTPDQALAGAHLAGPLKPPVWGRRAVGPFLTDGHPAPRRGSVTLDDLWRLLYSLPSGHT